MKTRVTNLGRFTKGQMAGEKNARWAGDNIGYSGVHQWVYKMLGKASVCTECGGNNTVQWANLSRKYLRDINDWKQLCVVCHRRFDGIAKLSKEDAQNIRNLLGCGLSQRKIAKKYGVSQGTVWNIAVNRTKYYA